MPNLQKETQQFSQELQTLALNLLTRVNSGCQTSIKLEKMLEKYIEDNAESLGKEKGLSPYFLLEACKYVKFSSGMDTKTILDFIVGQIPGKSKAIASNFPTDDVISAIQEMSEEDRLKVRTTIQLEAK